MRLFLPCLLYILLLSYTYTVVQASINESTTVPLNLFEVDGEVKALPQVASNLHFERSPFPTNIEEQLSVRSAHYWGRLYVYGWPAPIQYFRAHFGTAPPSGSLAVVLAEPAELCEVTDDGTTTSGDGITPLLVVRRGGCSFERKVATAKTLFPDLRALLVINDNDGLVHLASPQIHDTDVFVGLISESEGNQLSRFVQLFRPSPPLQAAVVPILCAPRPSDRTSTCDAITDDDRRAVLHMSQSGGYITVQGQDRTSFEFLQAHFGLSAPSVQEPVSLAMASPVDGCTALDNEPVSLLGKVVVVRRGGCPFVTKAKHAQEAGGLALLVAGHDMTLSRPGVEPRWHGLEIMIPVMMTTKAFWERVEEQADMKVQIELSTNVNSTDWEHVNTLHRHDAWPRSDTFRQKKLEEAMERFEGSWEKRRSIEEAFQRTQHDVTRHEL